MESDPGEPRFWHDGWFWEPGWESSAWAAIAIVTASASLAKISMICWLLRCLSLREA
jgi:hypothetical protein